MKKSTLFLLSALAITGVVCAQPPGDQGGGGDTARQQARAAMRKACGDDMKSLCPDAKGRAVGACLRTNHDKLSTDCQKAVDALPPPGAQPPPAGN